MGEDQPAHREVVGPVRVGMVNDETLVMPENEDKHERERRKQDMSGLDSMRPGRNGGGGCHGLLHAKKSVGREDGASIARHRGRSIFERTGVPPLPLLASPQM